MSEESGKHLEKSNEQKDKSNNQAGQPINEVSPPVTVEPGLPPRIPPSAPSQNQTKDNANPRKAHRPNWCEIVTVILELFGIIGLGVYCGYTIAEWRTFDSERKTMEKEFLAGVTNSQAQMSVMQAQLNEMKRASQLDERAWVFSSIEDNSVVVQSNSCVIMIRFKNIGKTPAINIGTIENSTADVADVKDVDPKVEGVRSSLAPGDNINMPYQIPNNLVLKLQDGKPIYVFGTIYYDDIFGMEHWTQFCYSIFNEGRTTLQPNFHNICDEIETNQTN